jgi:hypothetical protein
VALQLAADLNCPNLLIFMTTIFCPQKGVFPYVLRG